jgi:1-acyl-sn-glycerol-3-phosphate acyltransferase
MTSQTTDDVPVLPGIVPWIGRTWMKLSGWTIATGNPGLKKAVIIAAPHTSNWDLVYTLATAFALRLPIRWIGKHTLFEPPFGFMMRWLGGVPVDRRARNNAVKATAALFEEHDELLLVIPPEGIRGKATRWKTGFYYIAVEAGVPIIMGYVDYQNQRTGLGNVFHPSGNIEADMESIRSFYQDIRGKFPELQGSISLREDDASDASPPAG